MGVDFTNTGAWDVQIKNMSDNGRRKVNQLYSVISDRDINLSAQDWDCSMKGFLSMVGDNINDREIRKFEEGLNSKVKLLLYKTFNKVVEFKKYLHEKSDAG